MVSAAADVGGVYSAVFASDPALARTLRDICLFVYFFSHALMAPLIYVYMLYISGSVHLHRKRKWHFSMLMLPFVLMELMTLLNPINHMLYEVTPQMEYIRGPFIIIYYVIGAVYFVMALIDLIHRWNSVTKKCRNGLCFLFGFALFGIFLQYFVDQLQVEIFFEAVALMCIMIFIEDDEERMDVASGLLNRNALSMDLKNYISMEQDFSVTVV